METIRFLDRGWEVRSLDVLADRIRMKVSKVRSTAEARTIEIPLTAATTWGDLFTGLRKHLPDRLGAQLAYVPIGSFEAWKYYSRFEEGVNLCAPWQVRVDGARKNECLWRVEIRPRRPARSTHFLTVLYTADPGEKMVPVTLVRTDSGVGCRIDDPKLMAEVVFNTAGKVGGRIRLFKEGKHIDKAFAAPGATEAAKDHGS